MKKIDKRCRGSFGSLGVYIDSHVDSTPSCSLQVGTNSLQFVDIKSYMSEAMTVDLRCHDKANATLFGGGDEWREQIEISPSGKRRGPAEKSVYMPLSTRNPLPVPKPVRVDLELAAAAGPKVGTAQDLGSCQLTLDLL